MKTMVMLAAALFLSVAQARSIENNFNYAAAANKFGIAGLHHLFNEQPDQNVVYSPVSAHLALSMLLNGASGKTAEEIGTTLNIPVRDLAFANAKVVSLMSELNSRPEGELKLTLANGLWTVPRLRVKKNFVEAMKRDYQAEVASLQSAAQINQWAEKKTNGLIREVVDDIGGIVMILANATYFKAKWTMPFENSYPGEFTTLNGAKSQTKLMTNKVTTSYVRTGEYEAIELPYGSQKLASMILILPNESARHKEKPFNFLRRSLSADLLEQISGELKAAKEMSGQVIMPKVSFSTKWKMNDALSAMGMPSAFTGAADFSNLADDSVDVSYVKQDAVIKIDEEGTEAAAVTSIGIEATSVFVPEFTFRADRPFLYFIRDNASGVILFAGQIVNP